MNVGSLFSGIGGMDHGLARAGWQHAFFCESDEWRRTVLAHHWPGVPIYHDVRDVGRKQIGRSVQHGRGGQRGGGGACEPLDNTVDLLVGGFPCQDLSVAGQRRGLAGERSGLFFEFARIIDALRPRWVLVENVPGLLSSNGGRDFGIVLGTLADIGYGLGWRVLDSRFFGVPQRRRRVLIVGARAAGDPRAAAERAGEVLAVGTRCPGHPPTGAKAGPGASEPSTVSTLASSGKSGGWRVGADEAAGGQVVSYALNAKRGNRDDGESETFVTHALTPEDADATLVAAPLSHGSNPNSNMAGRGREDDVNLAASGTGVRRLTPVECERLQALPDGWTAHGPDSRRYAALGDAVTSSVAEWIGRRLLAHLKVAA